jgi:hypothetical protein
MMTKGKEYTSKIARLQDLIHVNVLSDVVACRRRLELNFPGD